MIIIKLLILVISVVVIAFIVNKVEYYYRNKKESTYLTTAISFKESMDLTSLPVVTFLNGDTKINFLLDTGSNVSQINESLLSQLQYIDLNQNKDIIGIEGQSHQTKMCKMNISYKDYTFENDFVVHDLTRAFDRIKQSTGVTIHGILGSIFFQKYKYILDYDELKAYSKHTF